MQELIYLHGFLSSPQSVKAQQTLAFFNKFYPQVKCHLPCLPGYPMEAIDIIESVVESCDQQSLRFVGSSMGGFLSTYFIEKYGGKAVIINPAVRPFELLQDYQGEHINPNTGEEFKVSSLQIEQLKSLYQSKLASADNYMVLLQTLDETLDYRQAEEKYQGAKLIIEEGGNHSFVNYENHLPDIADFLFRN